MDSLQEAIEKARQEREGRIGQTAVPGAKDNTNSRSSTEPEQAESVLSSSGAQYSPNRQADLDLSVLAHNRVIAGDIKDHRVEVYRQLRSQVLRTMRQKSWRTLSITSAYENAGKTLTAINLAISISQDVSQTVMLVDLDLRTPGVHSTLGIEVEKGIVDHLKDGEPFENILVHPGFPRLVILPGVAQERYSSEILTSPQMKSLMDDITGRYPDRIIIFDLPPLLRNDDALVFVPQVDACLFIVEDGVTRPDEIERSLHLLKGSQILGTVLNKAR